MANSRAAADPTQGNAPAANIAALCQDAQSLARDQIARILDEHFTALRARLEDTLARTSETQPARRVTARLNRSLRRLRNFESEEQWARALLEATNGFSERAALFLISNDNLRLRASRGVASGAPVDNLPLADAPAFAGAVESRDVVVALRTPGELSSRIADVLGDDPDSRAHLLPITTRDRVAAVLYADGDNVDSDALELICAAAAASLDAHSPRPDRTLVAIAPAIAAAPAPPRPAWQNLSRPEQEIHLRAQRFAKVRVAAIVLEQAADLKNGREMRDIYGAVKPSIDAARERYREDFMDATPSMLDYLHLELVRTLANDDADSLGPDYPGPMA